MFKEAKIKEWDVHRAHRNGCDEVKKTLENLFPSLELGVKPEFYSLDELTIELDENLWGKFIRIRTPGENLTSVAQCKDEGDYIWVPFCKLDGMRLFTKGVHSNFKILRD